MFFNSRNTRLCLHHSLEKWLIPALGWTCCQPDSKEALKDYQGCVKGLGHQLGEAPTG